MEVLLTGCKIYYTLAAVNYYAFYDFYSGTYCCVLLNNRNELTFRDIFIFIANVMLFSFFFFLCAECVYLTMKFYNIFLYLYVFSLTVFSLKFLNYKMSKRLYLKHLNDKIITCY